MEYGHYVHQGDAGFCRPWILQKSRVVQSHRGHHFMNAKRAKKYKMRRKFFNSGKEQCKKCGAALVMVTDLTGAVRGMGCPIC